MDAVFGNRFGAYKAALIAARRVSRITRAIAEVDAS